MMSGDISGGVAKYWYGRSKLRSAKFGAKRSYTWQGPGGSDAPAGCSIFCGRVHQGCSQCSLMISDYVGFSHRLHEIVHLKVLTRLSSPSVKTSLTSRIMHDSPCWSGSSCLMPCDHIGFLAKNNHAACASAREINVGQSLVSRRS